MNERNHQVKVFIYIYLNITCISLVSWQESYISLIYSLLFVLLTFFIRRGMHSRCCHHHAINHKTRFCCYANAYLWFSFFILFFFLSFIYRSSFTIFISDCLHACSSRDALFCGVKCVLHYNI